MITTLDWITYIWYALGAAILIYCAYTDIRTHKILNKVTYPAITASLIFAMVVGNLLPALLGGAVAVGILLLPRLLGVSRMGMGDVKLGALGGLMIGPQFTLFALALAFLAASVVMIPLMLAKKLNRKSKTPFGPYLSFGFLVFMALQAVILGTT